MLKATQIIMLLGFTLCFKGCGGGDNQNSQLDSDFGDLYAWRSNGPYAPTLKRCVATQVSNCTLNELPLIGMENMSPSIEDILDRVLVSHAWMGSRMEAVLQAFPPEMLTIFRGVTAIVIDDDIRPAYYTSGTGAIYIDPAFLWLTTAEANTINPKQDFRADYAAPLAFRTLFRYVINGQAAYSRRDFREPVERELEDIVALIANLFLHELAHANDHFPPSSLNDLPGNATVNDAANGNYPNWISTRLYNSSPLYSGLMYSLAGVMYRGNTPSTSDLATTIDEVAIEFELDSASDDYAYTSAFEDVAMLFEEVMMKYFFNADRDFVVTSPPDVDKNCNSYLIGWGLRNRVYDPNVLVRARFVVDEIFPNTIPESFYQQFMEPTELPVNIGWCELVESNNQHSKPYFKQESAWFDLPLYK